ncbi:MAG: diacylglycerol kinase [Caldilineaceae bacterium]
MLHSERSRWKRFSPQDKVRVFVAGVRFAVLHDHNVAIQMAISISVMALAFWLRAWFDFVLIMIVTGNIVVFEMLNTAVEAICDYIQPKHDPRIGAIKDLAAAATGIALIIWIVVILYEILRIFALLGNTAG